MAAGRIPVGQLLRHRCSDPGQPGNTGTGLVIPIAVSRYKHSNISVANEILGAKLGANDHRHAATPGHVQPFSLQQNGTSAHIRRRQATFRECLLSSRPRVRIALGAQVRTMLLSRSDGWGSQTGSQSCYASPMAETKTKRRGHGEDAIYFDHAGECRDSLR